MKKNVVDKILLFIFIISIVIELGITVGFTLLSNMDVDRFKNDMEIHVSK